MSEFSQSLSIVPPSVALTQAQRERNATFARAVEGYHRESLKIVQKKRQLFATGGIDAVTTFMNSEQVQAHNSICNIFSSVISLTSYIEDFYRQGSIPYAEKMRARNAALTAISTFKGPLLGSVEAALNHARDHPPSMRDCLLRQALAHGLTTQEAVELYNRSIAKANSGTVHSDGGNYRLTPNEIKDGEANRALLYAFMSCVLKDFSLHLEGNAIKTARTLTDHSIHADVNDVIEKVNLYVTELNKLGNLTEDKRRKVFTGEDQTHSITPSAAKKILNEAIGERKDVDRKFQIIADRLSPFVQGGLAYSTVKKMSDREVGVLSSCYIAMIAVLNLKGGDVQALKEYLKITTPPEIAPVILSPLISAENLFGLRQAATDAGTAAADVYAKLVLRTSGMAHLGGKQVELAFLPVTVTDAGVEDEKVNEPQTILLVTKYPYIVKYIKDNHGAPRKAFCLPDAGGRFEFYTPFYFRCFTGELGSGASSTIGENEPRLMVCNILAKPYISSETLEQYYVFLFGSTGKVDGVRETQSTCCLGRAVMAALYGVCTGDSMVVERVKNIHNQRMLAIQLAFDMFLRQF
jgi:hypothetical protein